MMIDLTTVAGAQLFPGESSIVAVDEKSSDFYLLLIMMS